MCARSTGTLNGNPIDVERTDAVAGFIWSDWKKLMPTVKMRALAQVHRGTRFQVAQVLNARVRVLVMMAVAEQWGSDPFSDVGEPPGRLG